MKIHRMATATEQGDSSVKINSKEVISYIDIDINILIPYLKIGTNINTVIHELTTIAVNTIVLGSHISDDTYEYMLECMSEYIIKDGITPSIYIWDQLLHTISISVLAIFKDSDNDNTEIDNDSIMATVLKLNNSTDNTWLVSVLICFYD